jgi:D-serine deaminase-like pyridoxal phosphate-dependent protein
MAKQEWYTINDVDQLDTPALVVYPDRVKYNIDLLKPLYTMLAACARM